MDARVLDLFSGTGAVGLEALSRGAKEVIFVDYHPAALELTKRNCELCLPSMSHAGVTAPRIVKSDLRRQIRLWPESHSSAANKCFDLIFLDPPYGKGLAEQTLEHIDSSNLCAEGALVIAEESNDVKLPETFEQSLNLTDKRRYGDTQFWFYTT